MTIQLPNKELRLIKKESSVYILTDKEVIGKIKLPEMEYDFELQKEWFEVDVEKIGTEYAKSNTSNIWKDSTELHEVLNEAIAEHFIAGYNFAPKAEFTEEDMIKMARECSMKVFTPYHFVLKEIRQSKLRKQFDAALKNQLCLVNEDAPLIQTFDNVNDYLDAEKEWQSAESKVIRGEFLVVGGINKNYKN